MIKLKLQIFFVYIILNILIVLVISKNVVYNEKKLKNKNCMLPNRRHKNDLLKRQVKNRKVILFNDHNIELINLKRKYNKRTKYKNLDAFITNLKVTHVVNHNKSIITYVKKKKLLFSNKIYNHFNYPGFDFSVLKENNNEQDKSRIGIIKTPRGDIETPNFLFCATKGCMKSTPIDFIKKCNTQVILSNTFHLLIQPKPHIIFQLGGLHKFMNWNSPILTDSGGYQIFSMSFGSVSNEIKRKCAGTPQITKMSIKNKKKDNLNNEEDQVNNNFINNNCENNMYNKKGKCLSNNNNSNNNNNNNNNNSEKSVTDTNNLNKQIILKLNEKGAEYKSYYDGSIDLLSPESSIQSQYLLGSDFILVLDECTPYHVDKIYTEKSMHRSHRWYVRCLAEFYKSQNMKNYHEYLNDIYNKKYKTNDKWIKRDKNNQAIYGIIQGGIYPDLRLKSCDFVYNLPFFGLCIGGCLGKDKDMMYAVIKQTMDIIHDIKKKKEKNTYKEKPIHLLGIGQIKDIIYGVKQGIDTFDCVIPSRLARHGYFLSKIKTIETIEKKLKRKLQNEYIKIKLSIFQSDNQPLEEDCACYTCQHYSRAYLHHLYKINDNLLGTLLTIHNVYYMNHLMQDIRNSIKEGNINQIEQKYIKK
ncbi:queuine tRNA-ribosyltransferase [Plasmodium falciparum NF54]|uniref:Queuine tRNA-ribosyltransferase, putative n=5 Tax=Plasmodium falciparum TaxID=5833 RepID=Q8I507_PLAF7|nr:queuine tRNA-ribosyltransferase, putative [Plasmodium falciparum 3D7]ETW60021.1 hypothetical protein PFMC_04010 [Plasmodium falciparum CAMP/Malaysia]KAF4327408.1 queuine tRNA-ribosyltransferase [Plasmodium falciparum NF54]PKC48214.1 queuine tRNA-ribosyltransferase [Plasmodium falciparum NF54]CZT99578.1 queuine tRNA-ribosyltransferase, putative [Plasmodium falciparum 3D7]|eukprot:XP_001350810.2 queuine tRNA-ribosyltransferase, putative [Plasmodium falciparum 3D7]